jgi:MFS family permease
MIAVNVGRGAIMATLAAAVAAGHPSVALIYALAFLLGSGQVVFDNAYQSYLPAIVARDQLERGNGRLFAIEVLATRFGGPPLGGLLFAIGASLPFFVDAASFVIAAAMIALIASAAAPSPTRSPHEPLAEEIRAGLRWLFGHPFFRGLAFTVASINFLYTAGISIFVLFATHLLSVGKTGFGVLLGASAIGAFAGSMLAVRVRDAIGYRAVLFLGLAISAAANFVIAAAPGAFVVGLMMAMSGFAGMVWNVINLSLRQRFVPNELLGRVNSVVRLLAWGAIPLGAVTGGLLAHTFGLRAPFVLAGFGMAALSLYVIPLSRHAPTEALNASIDEAPTVAAVKRTA